MYCTEVWLCHSPGPNSRPDKIDAVSNPKGFFGTTRFGFSKANEVFVGRTGVLRPVVALALCCVSYDVGLVCTCVID